MTYANNGKISFKALANTRDLGGLPACKGKRIASHKLIRSGALFRATEEDANILLDEYRLKKVVDLRTEEERSQKPDPVALFPGVCFIDVPLLNTEALGITRSSTKAGTLKTVLGLMKDPIELMERVYPKIVLEDSGKKGIKQFFDILLESDEGSVLWHCSAGKDRVGIVSALLLSALGVTEDIIIEDYLATNKFMQTSTQEILSALASYPLPSSARESVKVLNSADARFFQAALHAIDEEYGTLENYLAQAIGVTEDAKAILREKFLEG